MTRLQLQLVAIEQTAVMRPWFFAWT